MIGFEGGKLVHCNTSGVGIVNDTKPSLVDTVEAVMDIESPSMGTDDDMGS
jgi:hypothetical protein